MLNTELPEEVTTGSTRVWPLLLFERDYGFDRGKRSIQGLVLRAVDGDNYERVETLPETPLISRGWSDEVVEHPTRANFIVQLSFGHSGTVNLGCERRKIQLL